MTIQLFVFSVLNQIRKGCEDAGCDIPDIVSFDIGIVANREFFGISNCGDQRLKFVVPFLPNAHVDSTKPAP